MIITLVIVDYLYILWPIDYHRDVAGDFFCLGRGVQNIPHTLFIAIQAVDHCNRGGYPLPHRSLSHSDHGYSGAECGPVECGPLWAAIGRC